MTHRRAKIAKTFVATLCLSASLIVPASAAELTFLPDIPSDQIARDTERSYDSRTGVSTVTAPTFDPFEQDNTLAGTAALRTGPSETTLEGQRVIGGAYLDLKMIYTSPSDDPYDMRGYEQAYYVSGEPVSRIHQDVRTLDCASNTTEVVYQDDYYNSYDNYGYLAGLYLLLPQYRGHRGYWGGSSRHSPFVGWSDWRRRGSYYSGRSNSVSRFSTGGRSTRGNGTGNNGRGNGSRGVGTGGRGTGNLVNSPTAARTERHNGRNAVIGGSAESREYSRQRGVVTGGPLQTSRGNRAERNTERAASERADRRNDRSRQDRTERRDPNTDRNTATRTTTRSTPRTERPAIRETVTNRRANPAGAPPSTIARQTSPRPISRPAPVKPKTERKSNSESKSNAKSKSRSSRKLNREVDRSFSKNKRAIRGKQMNFFPMLGGYNRARTDVVTNYRCVREETVTLHIPQERLDAARFDGMTLVVVDNADRDVPIYLPPNYIEGFRQATGHSSIAPSRSTYTAPSTTIVTPQPTYTEPSYTGPGQQGGYPQN